MLRSGNGQHRRPRQAPAFVVTAGATGAGIALPLLAATGAHAATTSTWDRVAQCESGGLWSQNSGNGFYGGLQLTMSDWQKYGGTAYAERPDLASRQEQIAVAEKVLEGEGVAAWQDCAVSAGLTQGGPAPVVDTGGVAAAAPSDAKAKRGGSSGLSDRSGGLGSVAPLPGNAGTVGADASGLSATPSPAPSASSSAAPGASPTAIPSPSAAVSSSASAAASAGAAAAPSRGRHAKPVAAGVLSSAPVQGDVGVVAAATGSLDPLAATAGSAVYTTGGSYTVQPGDNLSQIATDHTVSGDWAALYAANKSTIGANPDLIHPGQHLTLG